ncbi:cobalamin biosynthesis protein [Geobacillus stearothermophilus]|uniref:bifunctional adenosylcobinamide kinase/adenosylcobinamide-phosphate guanylyltransferase n=1 Tax=Geobacillus stearothermophilus TaxID=1422 RepID=UPI00066FBFC9|nr:bifunctional adenosylcobinamide kinase/adenosylcobinamide-phosphate guanylyltransferase [Geobacillus stearothermophilus]KMY62887.1 cobalamin biosynthesis protein [Geobacillus stearothermophilus]
MHFVVGGAFQGRRKWVRERYGISDGVHIVWHDGYQEPYGWPDGAKTAKTVVLDGLEAAIRRLPDPEEWERFFCAWKQWEEGAAGRTVVWIGTDVTQGVVPTDRQERRWRDAVGLCYQQLAAVCHRVDRLWCGLAERLK